MPVSSYLDIAAEVRNALDSGGPVVALESTIISHGMPWPRNVETALQVESAIRDKGALPATIAIVDGRLKAGLSQGEIENLGKLGQSATKTSRRDIPFLMTREGMGATTVAATMIIAAMADIRVFATGGIGGVHRQAEDTMDISADLEELSRTNMAVVCAGAKSVLDIGRTLEYLETKGVPVIGFGTNALPAFYTRESGFDVDYRIDKPAEIASVMHAKWQAGLNGGLVIANPIPEEHALKRAEIDRIVDDAIADMNAKGITGKATTPFLLEAVASRTDGRSLDANIQLVLNNARLAADVAIAFAAL